MDDLSSFALSSLPPLSLSLSLSLSPSSLSLSQVDVLIPTKVSGMVTLGSKDFGRVQFVRSYKLPYSNDRLRWNIYQEEAQYKDKVFRGNIDNNTHRKNFIQPPIYGLFLRLIPWFWSRRITLRMELLG
uniref:F5/8 type C domain-containing protein n=2 Tax=Hucho hucho TaxID=62062 RepID=A0A4W5KT57_9TELE